MTSKKIIIVGHGGFAREVAWLIRDITAQGRSTQFNCVGHVISDMNGQAAKDGLLGDFNWLQQNRHLWDSLTIGIGTPDVRAKIFYQLNEVFPDADWPTLIHPSVLFDSASAKIGRGTIICANVVGTVNLKIEESVVVNLSCTVGHEAEIGLGSVVNPSVNVSGGVKIGHRVLVGTGAQILQNLTVADDANIGAGAVVTKDVQARTTVVGIPAKILAPK